MSLPDIAVEFVNRRYGKNYVRLLHVKREGDVHYIKELEVSTALTLNDAKDYLYGDNSGIIATDTQKNTVYILAKKFGIGAIEDFAMLLSNHFLQQYDHVIKTWVYIEEKPWQRIPVGTKAHNHAYVQQGSGVRVCEVNQEKHGKPSVKSGVNNLTLLKTTQSAFVNFVRDEYRSLPDMKDRIFCTVLEAMWEYKDVSGVNFDASWDIVKNVIFDVFAGPADTGVFSPSVQKTLYDIQKQALAKIPQMANIEVILPNVHAYEVDLNKFPAFGFTKNAEVFQPTDKPSGNIRAKLRRNLNAKL